MQTDCSLSHTTDDVLGTKLKERAGPEKGRRWMRWYFGRLRSRSCKLSCLANLSGADRNLSSVVSQGGLEGFRLPFRYHEECGLQMLRIRDKARMAF